MDGRRHPPWNSGAECLADVAGCRPSALRRRQHLAAAGEWRERLSAQVAHERRAAAELARFIRWAEGPGAFESCLPRVHAGADHLDLDIRRVVFHRRHRRAISCCSSRSDHLVVRQRGQCTVLSTRRGRGTEPLAPRRFAHATAAPSAGSHLQAIRRPGAAGVSAPQCMTAPDRILGFADPPERRSSTFPCRRHAVDHPAFALDKWRRPDARPRLDGGAGDLDALAALAEHPRQQSGVGDAGDGRRAVVARPGSDIRCP